MSGNIIVVSEKHPMPIPLVYNLGEHSLVVTSDYGAPEAFELATPVITEEGEESADSSKTLILDADETSNLYQCLHEWFHPAGEA